MDEQTFPDPPPLKKARRKACRLCLRPGYNARTCPTRIAAENAAEGRVVNIEGGGQKLVGNGTAAIQSAAEEDVASDLASLVSNSSDNISVKNQDEAERLIPAFEGASDDDEKNVNAFAEEN